MKGAGENIAHWKPGQSGNPLGRPKDSSSKQNLFIRESIALILSNGAEKLANEMQNLHGIHFVNAYCALLEYAVPKRARIQIADSEDDKPKECFKIGEQIIYFS